MVFKDPFRPKLFCDSKLLCTNQKVLTEQNSVPQGSDNVPLCSVKLKGREMQFTTSRLMRMVQL